MSDLDRETLLGVYAPRTAEERRYRNAYPELHVTIFATPEGMRSALVAHVPGAAQYGRGIILLDSAAWCPPAVTLRDCVDWARRACEAWLRKDQPAELPPEAD